MGKTSFGGTCLEDLGIVVERVHDEIGSLEDDLESVSGGDGSIFRGVRVPSRTITLECRAFEDRWQDYDALISTLMNAFLSSREERQLRVRTRTGYYMAHLTEYAEGDREGGTGVGAFELTFVASDPYLVSDSQTSVTVTTSGVTFTVGGSCPVRARITSSNARRDSTTQQWGVSIDGSTLTRVTIPVTTASSVVIDGVTRAVTINGATSMVTLDSDWIELSPGQHVAEIDLGSGTATLTWQERSL